MILTMAMAAALAMQTDQATPPRRARSNLNQYFSTDDYPPTAVARGAQGTAGFRLDIGADGAVTGCTITRSAGDAALDAATCAILLGRARYEPARDSAGRPVRGKDWGRVTWRLPPPAPGMPFARVRRVTRLSSNGAGELDCVVTVNGVADTDSGPTYCGDLSGTGANEMLRQIPAPIGITLVSEYGPEDSGIAVAGADEAGFGVLQYDVVSDILIDRDGRMAQCRVATRNDPAGPFFEYPPDFCELPPPGASPMFEPSTDPAPRRGRLRSALYIKGWPADLPGPRATPERPPRP